MAAGFLFALFFCAVPMARAFEVEGYPGSLWGSLTYDDDKRNGANSAGMGFVNQGIQWFTLPTNAHFVTYAEFRRRARTYHPEYYDTGGPAVGAELRWDYITLGVDYYWERHVYDPLVGATSNRLQYYATLYYTWSLADKLGWAEALPGAVWGQTTYDTDDYSGSSMMGFVNQGIQWFTLPGNIPFITYVEYRHRTRSKNQGYYDTKGPAAGFEFRKSYFTLGADYYWMRELDGPQTNTMWAANSHWQVYFTLFIPWDLK
ncbi:MAG: hypothetical protein HZA03_00860 [Nitrospinae bacterium]|nr:hypothetical protein [Nitrospinota bacterium]